MGKCNRSKNWLVLNKKIILIGLLLCILITPVRAGLLEDILNFFSGQDESELSASSTATYSTNSKTECVNSSCNLILHSTTKYVLENGTWIDVIDAKSLKNTSIKCEVKEEENYKAECVDWNATSITFEAEYLLASKKGSVVPIKVYRINESGEKLANASYYLVYELNHTFYKDDSAKAFSVPYKWGDVVHFGFTSTELILQDANSENLNDDDTWRAGDDYRCLFDDEDRNPGVVPFYCYVMFNISAIPSGATINDADFYGFVQSDRLDGADIVQFWTVHNWTWNEEDGSTLAMITGGGANNTNNLTGADLSTNSWANFGDITDFVDFNMNQGNNNLTIGISLWEDVGDDGDDYARIATKEDTGNHPYLNITYTAGSPPVENPNCTIYVDTVFSTNIDCTNYNFTARNNSHVVFNNSDLTAYLMRIIESSDVSFSKGRLVKP